MKGEAIVTRGEEIDQGDVDSIGKNEVVVVAAAVENERLSEYALKGGLFVGP